VGKLCLYRLQILSARIRNSSAFGLTRLPARALLTVVLLIEKPSLASSWMSQLYVSLFISTVMRMNVAFCTRSSGVRGSVATSSNFQNTPSFLGEFEQNSEKRLLFRVAYAILVLLKQINHSPLAGAGTSEKWGSYPEDFCTHFS
jgi:hypothetical protein